MWLARRSAARTACPARRRGYIVQRGSQSQLAEHLAYLIRLDERTGRAERPRRTLEQAFGLLSVPGKVAPSDEDVNNLQ